MGTGRSDRVSGEQLGQILRDRITMRLVVLNACEGARSAPTTRSRGWPRVSSTDGIPSVIGMQFEISDRAAILFAADSTPLADCGLSMRPWPRAGARSTPRNVLEWATPVLFMRSDGHDFDVPEGGSIAHHHRPACAPATSPHAPGRRRTRARGGRRRVRVLPPRPQRPDARSERRQENRGPAAAAASSSTTLAEAVVAAHGAAGTLQAACPASASLQVPGALKPRVQTGTVQFTSAFVCERPVEGIVRVQYSVARSELDLNRFFNWRENGAHLAAFAVEGLCGSTLNALDYWRPAGTTGHDVVTSGQGVGRVVCYERNGLSGSSGPTCVGSSTDSEVPDRARLATLGGRPLRARRFRLGLFWRK